MSDEDWLTRLSAPEWLDASANELRQCEQALTRRAYRPAVTHARRAAGMALNALLRLDPSHDWGRSYMDHLRAVQADDTVPQAVRRAALTLQQIPAAQPELVALGKPDTTSLQAARVVHEWAAGRSSVS